MLLHAAAVAVGCNVDDRTFGAASLQGERDGDDAGTGELGEREPEGPAPGLTGNGGASGEAASALGGGAGGTREPGPLSGTGGGTTGAGGASSLPGSGGASGDGGSSGLGGTGPATAGFTGRAGAELCPAGPYPSPFSGVPQVRQLFALSDNRHIDGPVWLDGALYFAAIGGLQGPARIDRFVLGGTLETSFIADTGSLGLALDTQGNLLSASYVPSGVYRFALPSGAESQVSSPGASFITPNDLVQRSDGNIYLTDLHRDYLGATGLFRNTQALRITPTGEVLELDPNLREANGITLSPDGNHLYVTTRTTFVRYPLAADGTPLSAVALFTNEPPQSPEGMAMDCAGNVYTTESARRLVRVFDPFGAELGRFGGLDVFAGDLSNLAFGGPDRTTLFITTFAGATPGAVYTAELGVPGLPY